MGIDFNSFNGFKQMLEGIAKTAGKISVNKGQDKNEGINNAEELFTFNTMAKGVESQTDPQNIEQARQAEREVLSAMLDYNFAKNEVGLEDKNEDGFFSEDEISLETLASYLDENIDMEKVNKYNEKGVIAEQEELDAINTLEKAEFDKDLINVLMQDDSIAGAIRYIVKDILSGRADEMAKNYSDVDSGNEGVYGALRNQEVLELVYS